MGGSASLSRHRGQPAAGAASSSSSSSLFSSFAQSIPIVQPRPINAAAPAAASSSSSSLLSSSLSSSSFGPSARSHLQSSSALSASQSHPPLSLRSRPLRPAASRADSSSLSLCLKLSVRLMDTYNGINDKYYTNKAVLKQEERERRRREREQREKEKQDAKTQQQQQQQQQAALIAASSASSSSSSLPLSLPLAPVSPVGYDDRDGNYIVRGGELLHARYCVEHSLGKGSFGRVIQCRDTLDGRLVAVKIIKSKKAFFKQAQVELRILQSLQPEAERQNIVLLLDSFMHRNHQCIVFELLSINLYELIRNTRFAGVTLLLVAKFAFQLLTTLSYLTSAARGERRVIHCDIKPENILLRTKQRSAIKLIDFGSACYSDEKAYTYIQSRFYRAPEVLLGLPYGPAIDMWSLGCLLMELHTGHPLFDGVDEKEQVVRHYELLGAPPAHMVEGNSKALQFFDCDSGRSAGGGGGGGGGCRLRERYETRKISSLQTELGDKFQQTEQYRSFLDLVSRMLCYDPRQRIKPLEAKRHPFFDILQQTAAQSRSGMASSSSSSPVGMSPSAGPAPPPAATAAAGSLPSLSLMADIQPAATRANLQQSSIPMFSSFPSSSSSTSSSAFFSSQPLVSPHSSLPRQAVNGWPAVSVGSHAGDADMGDAEKENGVSAALAASSHSSRPSIPPMSRRLSDLHTRPNVRAPLPPSDSQEDNSGSPSRASPSPPLPPAPVSKPVILPVKDQRRRRKPALSDSRTARTNLVMSLRSRSQANSAAAAAASAASSSAASSSSSAINTSNRFAALQSSPSHASQEDGSNDSMTEQESPNRSNCAQSSRPVLRSQRRAEHRGEAEAEAAEKEGDLHVLMTDDAVSESPTSGGRGVVCLDRRGSNSLKDEKGEKEGKAGRIAARSSRGKVVELSSGNGRSNNRARQSPISSARKERRRGRSRKSGRGGDELLQPQGEARLSGLAPSSASQPALVQSPPTGMQTRSSQKSIVTSTAATAMEDTEAVVAPSAAPPSSFHSSSPLLTRHRSRERNGLSKPRLAAAPAGSSSGSKKVSSSSGSGSSLSLRPRPAVLSLHSSPRPSHFSNAPPANSGSNVALRRPTTRQSLHSSRHQQQQTTAMATADASTAAPAEGDEDGSISQRTRSHITMR